MTSKQRHGAASKAARRRGELGHAEGDRTVGQAMGARRYLATRRVRQVRVNGRATDAAGRGYMHLSAQGRAT
jgi:hypothetical protein